MGQGFLPLALLRFTGFLKALRHIVIVHLRGLGALPDLVQHDFFQHWFRDTVLSTMRFAKSVVGFAAVYRYMVVRIRYPMRQRFSAFTALDQPGEETELSIFLGTQAAFQLLLHDLKGRLVDDRFVAAFYHNPIFRLLFADRSQLEAVIPFLSRHSTNVYWIDQQVFDDAEIPYIFPIFGVELLPAGEGKVPQSALPAPPGGCRDLRCFQLFRIKFGPWPSAAN